MMYRFNLATDYIWYFYFLIIVLHAYRILWQERSNEIVLEENLSMQINVRAHFFQFPHNLMQF